MILFCNNTEFVRNTINNSEFGISSSSSNNNRFSENTIFNNSYCGIRFILGSGHNEIYKNNIISCNTGIYITKDSFDNNLYDNLFSSNNQKVVNETIVDENKSSGFELVILTMACIIIFLKRRSNQ